MKEVGPRLRRESIDRNDLKSKTYMHLREEERETERSGIRNHLVPHSHDSVSLFARKHTSQSRRTRNSQRQVSRRTDRQMVKGDNKFRGPVRRE